MAKVQKNHKGIRHILATDLDGTLVGDINSLGEFNSYMFRNRNDFLLVYTTGRIFPSAWDLIIEERLLLPHVLITDVGTEIRFAPHFKPDKKWEIQMKKEWNREKVKVLMANYSELTTQGVSPGYRLAYKVETRQFDHTINKIIEEIIKSGLPVQVVPSLGSIMDIIPQKAGKGSALKYLQQLLGFQSEHIIVCGDSGNDFSMFENGYKGIVVGNAQRELLQKLTKDENEVYFAKENYAAGIIEGLIHYGIIESKNNKVVYR